MKHTHKLFSILLCLAMLMMLVPTSAKAATANILSVKKTDAQGNPLSGAVFTLTGVGNSVGRNYDATSGADGIAEFNVTQDGDYELKEEMAPDGYVVSSETYRISVYEGRIQVAVMESDEVSYRDYETITFVNEKLPTYSFTVKKTDKDGKPLAGAVFSLTGTGNYIGHNYEATSGADGIATFDVREGFYTLAEKIAPDGYLGSDKTYEISVYEGKAHFVGETEGQTTYTDYETVTYVNEKIVKTGDMTNMFLWIAALLVSGGALAGTVLLARKRRV